MGFYGDEFFVGNGITGEQALPGEPSK